MYCHNKRFVTIFEYHITVLLEGFSAFPDYIVLPDGAGRVPDGDAVCVHLGVGEGGERPPSQDCAPQRERRGRHRT